jgi:hypothetical protein
VHLQRAQRSALRAPLHEIGFLWLLQCAIARGCRGDDTLSCDPVGAQMDQPMPVRSKYNRPSHPEYVSLHLSSEEPCVPTDQCGQGALQFDLCALVAPKVLGRVHLVARRGIFQKGLFRHD